MTTLEWAEKEIEIACKRDDKVDDKDFDYAKSCFDSALKAYRLLAADEHSGMSWSITRKILTRLMNDIPLTEIEDTEDVWDDRSAWFEGKRKIWQCKRCSSLFKHLDENGKIFYTDSNRTVCVDEKGSGWNDGLSSSIVDELFPVTMPYLPSDRKYKIFKKEYTSKHNKGETDTIEFTHIVTPDGYRLEVNKYFKQEDNSYKEMNRKEFLEWLELPADEYTNEEKCQIRCDETGNEEGIPFWTTLSGTPDYEGALVGFTDDDRAIYDYDLMVQSMMERDKCTAEEAIEWIEYNTLGAYLGEKQPIVMYKAASKKDE